MLHHTADDRVPKRHRNDLASPEREVVKLLVDRSGAWLLKVTERVVICLAYIYIRAGPLLLCIFDISFFMCVCGAYFLPIYSGGRQVRRVLLLLSSHMLFA